MCDIACKLEYTGGIGARIVQEAAGASSSSVVCSAFQTQLRRLLQKKTRQDLPPEIRCVEVALSVASRSVLQSAQQRQKKRNAVSCRRLHEFFDASMNFAVCLCLAVFGATKLEGLPDLERAAAALESKVRFAQD
jgi:hypothetical protein